MRRAIVACVVLCAAAVGQDRVTAEHTMLTEPGFHVARARASQDAWDLSDAVNRARTAVRAGDAALASAQISRALGAAGRLQSQGHGSDVVPIYTELTEKFAKGPAGAQRTISSEADRLRFGATDQAATPISATPQYHTMSLNMAGVAAHLKDADAAVSDRQWNAADQALAAVQNALTVQSSAADLPRLQARQNLNLAAEQARQGAFQVTQTTLRTAVRQLRQSADPSVGRLADEIAAYSDTLLTQHDDALARIEDWWDRAARLSAK